MGLKSTQIYLFVNKFGRAVNWGSFVEGKASELGSSALQMGAFRGLDLSLLVASLLRGLRPSLFPQESPSFATINGFSNTTYFHIVY